MSIGAFNLTIDTSRMPEGWSVSDWLPRVLAEVAFDILEGESDGGLIYDPRTNAPPIGNWNLFGPAQMPRPAPYPAAQPGEAPATPTDTPDTGRGSQGGHGEGAL